MKIRIVILACFCSAGFLCADDVVWLNDAVAQKALDATVSIDMGDRKIVGFFVSADGLIVTVAQNLGGPSAPKIRSSTGEEMAHPELMAVDPINDLAVIATGSKPKAFLELEESFLSLFEAIVIPHLTQSGRMGVAHGRFFAQRPGADASNSRIVEVLSLGLAPTLPGTSGAPVVTRSGRAAGMCDSLTVLNGQKMYFAVPGKPVGELIALARKTRRPLSFSKIAELMPLNSPVVSMVDRDYAEGVRLISVGDFEGAVEKFKVALKAHPRNPRLMHLLANVLAKTEHYAEARILLEEARQIDPANLNTRQLLGDVIRKMGELDQAITCFGELTRDFPQYAIGWGSLGLALRERGNKAEAVSALKKCAEFMPDNMGFLRMYADALADNGQMEESFSWRQRADDLESMLFKVRYSTPKRQ
ncbi:MAG: tetratricopeptide repeat-containing serine protease family protein [Verrucomicrobia bacterium]|nr:tetratricopeptide repeat-containing serine protease family protein [Verrucomicrobiota bacterium]